MFILAAALIVAGVALFVAAPLGIGLVGARAKSAGELQTERHEHERALAVQGLRELEFDREMGKLSDADYESMHKALEDRALTAMAAVEKIHDQALNAKKPSRHTADATQTRTCAAPDRSDTDPRRAQRTTAPAAARRRRRRRAKFASVPNAECAPQLDAKFCAQCGIAIRPIPGAIARSE